MIAHMWVQIILKNDITNFFSHKKRIYIILIYYKLIVHMFVTFDIRNINV